MLVLNNKQKWHFVFELLIYETLYKLVIVAVWMYAIKASPSVRKGFRVLLKENQYLQIYII